MNYNKALQMEPNDFQVNNTLNLFYLDIADTNPEFVDYPKALTYALKAYNSNSSSSAATQNLGIAYFFNQKFDTAITYFLKTDINKEPYMALWLGYCYMAKQQPDAAMRYFNIAAKAGVDIPSDVKDYMNEH